MKKIISIMMAAAIVLCFASCNAGKTKSEPDKTSEITSSSNEKLDVKCNVYALNGPTGVGLTSLMKKANDGEARLDYTIKTVGANDEIVAKLNNKEADIAAIATNLASTLFKKTNGGIKVLAANTLGVLCLVTKGEEITDIQSLKGKTIYMTGKGANPEYIVKYILEKNGLKMDTDVKVNFLEEPAQLVTTVSTNEKAIVVAPQPVATTITVKDTASKIVFDLNKEWDKVSDTKLVMGCIVARTEYIEQNPEAVKVFLDEYKESVNDVNNNIDKAADLCAEYGIVASAPIAKKAIPFCNIVFEDGDTLKKDLSAYLEFLFGSSPASVGGELPTDSFYYAQK